MDERSLGAFAQNREQLASFRHHGFGRVWGLSPNEGVRGSSVDEGAKFLCGGFGSRGGSDGRDDGYSIE
jgi:hypothetical protein